VETHVRHCVAKLGARNRPHAVALALQRGEIVLTRPWRAGPARPGPPTSSPRSGASIL